MVLRQRARRRLADDKHFGGVCIFESDDFVLDGRPDLQEQTFAQLGFTLRVLLPGKPNGMYHAETDEEDFLVLSGECLLLIENEERHLRAWDFVHCPRATAHIFVGAGESPCVILAVGARTGESGIVYPPSEVARRHGASVERRRTRARRPTERRRDGASAARRAGTSCPGRTELPAGVVVEPDHPSLLGTRASSSRPPNAPRWKISGSPPEPSNDATSPITRSWSPARTISVTSQRSSASAWRTAK